MMLVIYYVKIKQTKNFLKFAHTLNLTTTSLEGAITYVFTGINIQSHLNDFKIKI